MPLFSKDGVQDDGGFSKVTLHTVATTWAPDSVSSALSVSVGVRGTCVTANDGTICPLSPNRCSASN